MMTNGRLPKRSVRKPVAGPAIMRGNELAAAINATSRNEPPTSYAKRGRTSQRPPVPKDQKPAARKTGIVSRLSTSRSVDGPRCALMGGEPLLGSRVYARESFMLAWPHRNQRK